MIVDISWWDLDGCGQTIDSLRNDLREGSAVPWRDVPGLRLKVWIADLAANRWGAVMIWEQDPPDPATLPPNRAAHLIGRPPACRQRFRAEAAIVGAPATWAERAMHDYVVVDAFARRPLSGNPVAVFFAADDLAAGRMQDIAREMNLSEVTFVLAPERGGDARIRIFTPVNELPFAGHPLLGTVVALDERWPRDRLRLETAMGIIPVTVERGGGARFVRMRQPVPGRRPYERAAELLAALGVAASTLPVEVYHNGPRHVFVGVGSVAALSAIRPDHRALGAFPDMAANCFADAGDHWRTRMFSPAYGVVEDAATGSAAGPLAVHLARHGHAAYGTDLEIVQGVEIGRPSPMTAAVHGDRGTVRAVEVGGHGVVAARGTIDV